MMDESVAHATGGPPLGHPSSRYAEDGFFIDHDGTDCKFGDVTTRALLR